LFFFISTIMPQQPLEVHGLTAATIHRQTKLLINNLVNITDHSGEFLLKLPDGRIIDTKGWNDWEWTHGIGLYGLYHYYTLTGSQETLNIMQSWFEARFLEGTTKNINTMSPFLTLAYLYDSPDRKATYLPWLDTWAEWAMYELPRTRFGGMQHMTYLTLNENELWDDTLMMTVLPLIKIGLILDRPHYVEEGKRQFLLHIQYLMDHPTGLFFHGWKFDSSKPGVLGHNFARARWARGNSWITIAIPEVLEMLNLPADDHFHVYLVDVLRAQIEALKSLQAESGLWRTLLDVPESEGSYLEASATAGFAYGMLKSIRKKYISREEYEECAIKAVKGVLDRIGEDGELSDVSFGTGMGDDLEHYLKIARTSMPYGQAMAMMALGEFLRVFI
jgi:unsaturated rhamnogalacturonyl hydrolase